MKKLIGAAIVVAVLGAGFLAYRVGFFGPRTPAAVPPGQAGSPGMAAGAAAGAGAGGGVGGGAQLGGGSAAASGSGAETAAGGAAAAAGAGAGGTAAGSGAVEPPADLAALMPDGNIARFDLGAHVESFTSDYGRAWSAHQLIAGTGGTWETKDTQYPQEAVISFLGRQPVLISAVAASSGRDEEESAKDFEIWVSMISPTEGFSRVGAFTLAKKADSQTFAFPPAEARFVKVRLLSNYGNKNHVQLARLKIIEAQRAGYTSLLARNPELVALASGRLPAGWTVTPERTPTADADSAATAGCAPLSTRATPVPRQAESRNVFVVARDGGLSWHPPVEYKPTDTKGGLDYSIYGRIGFVVLAPDLALPAQLAGGFDTLVLAQVCDIKDSVSEPFKRALVPWVAQGHKLIIQDSDECGGSRIPDYSFLPFPFATSNPGAQGARGPTLFFVEENHLVNNKPGDPAFLDVESWLASKNGSENEIGDSNTIFKYDAHWCGQLFGTNVKKVNGFMLAYAHYGRGLIIYDGFDEDQRNGVAYRQLVTRELALGFDPDGLPCSARLGDFVITTEQRLKVQPMVPGRTYVYPLTLYSNQGYKGTVDLTLAPTPAEPGLQFRFEPSSVPLEEISTVTLTVKAAASASPQPHVLTVKGTDAGGKTNTLCLQLTERSTGGIQVLSDLRRDKKPTKNLEIILDSSGSMKAALGKKTRWTTALDVLEQVLQKLPDDFNVGLRIYGHRESSLSPKTCTDSELVVPIGKLHRGRLLSAARGVKPRGETPLVYSVLQTPEDLKAVGGGTVILITDGEESCKGDVKAAAQAVRQSGLDVTVNIVGFTLTGRQTQAQLTTLAEGTGGHYYVAQSGEALARALLIAAVEKFPYVIYDAAGKVVAKGEAGGAPEELPAGEYKVVITAGDQTLTEAVTVATGGDVALRVQLKGDRFVVQR